MTAETKWRDALRRVPTFCQDRQSMPDEPSAIPLADVLRAANELVSADLIQGYALGGALAAICYTEPFTTYDADIIFVASDKTLSAGIPAIQRLARRARASAGQRFPCSIPRCVRIDRRGGSQCEPNRKRRRTGKRFPSRILHCHRRQRRAAQRLGPHRTTDVAS